MNEQERLLLAESIGWNLEYNKDVKRDMWQSPDRRSWYSDLKQAFQPETDANDDYGVLEWVRVIEEEGLDREMLHMRFAAELCGLKSMYDYRVGDYARAAITVLQQRTEANDG